MLAEAVFAGSNVSLTPRSQPPTSRPKSQPTIQWGIDSRGVLVAGGGSDRKGVFLIPTPDGEPAKTKIRAQIGDNTTHRELIVMWPISQLCPNKNDQGYCTARLRRRIAEVFDDVARRFNAEVFGMIRKERAEMQGANGTSVLEQVPLPRVLSAIKRCTNPGREEVRSAIVMTAGDVNPDAVHKALVLGHYIEASREGRDPLFHLTPEGESTMNDDQPSQGGIGVPASDGAPNPDANDTAIKPKTEGPKLSEDTIPLMLHELAQTDHVQLKGCTVHYIATETCSAVIANTLNLTPKQIGSQYRVLIGRGLLSPIHLGDKKVGFQLTRAAAGVLDQQGWEYANVRISPGDFIARSTVKASSDDSEPPQDDIATILRSISEVRLPTPPPTQENNRSAKLRMAQIAMDEFAAVLSTLRVGSVDEASVILGLALGRIEAVRQFLTVSRHSEIISRIDRILGTDDDAMILG